MTIYYQKIRSFKKKKQILCQTSVVERYCCSLLSMASVGLTLNRTPSPMFLSAHNCAILKKMYIFKDEGSRPSGHLKMNSMKIFIFFFRDQIKDYHHGEDLCSCKSSTSCLARTYQWNALEG